MCVPRARVEELKVATPEVFNVAVASCVAPSKNVTLPVGVPLPEVGVTVAVNVTLWPEVTCVAETVRVVAVAARVVLAGVNTRTVAEYAGKV